MTATAPACLACDIGGSSVAAALVAADGRMEGRVDSSLDSSTRPDEVFDQLATVLGMVLSGSNTRPQCLGLAVPGPFDEATGSFRIVDQAKFEQLHGIPLLPELFRRVPQLAGLPTAFINDARAFALGELKYGAAQGCQRAIILTLGTGCGSAFSKDGQLVFTGDGVPDGGFVYAIRYRGRSVDEEFSTRGLLRRWRDLGRWETSVAGIARLAEESDADAVTVFGDFGTELVSALEPVLRRFAPDCLVTGGGIARAFPLFAPAARQRLAALQLNTDFKVAGSLENSALLGAACHALKEVQA